ncbi:UNVERIFIED_CONTAM: hypothetical protein HDU68_003511 [Siphonaria sp. JEL0065]|nr:hypothetical protein HDU68_003511 [Siphonaria sp. JEL0065]
MAYVAERKQIRVREKGKFEQSKLEVAQALKAQTEAAKKPDSETETAAAAPAAEGGEPVKSIEEETSLNKTTSNSRESKSSSSLTQLKKRYSTYGLMNGEHPKWSHTRRDDSFSSIDHSLQNAMALLEKETTPAQVPPAALVDRFAAIPEAHQLSLWVVEHLGALLTRLNGQLEGEDCEWLAPQLLFKYYQLFNTTPFHTATFYGFSKNDTASVLYLQDLYKSVVME